MKSCVLALSLSIYIISIVFAGECSAAAKEPSASSSLLGGFAGILHSVTDTFPTITDTVEKTLNPAVEPVLSTVTETIGATLTPVVEPVVSTVTGTVGATLTPIVEPVVSTVRETVAAITETVGAILKPETEPMENILTEEMALESDYLQSELPSVVQPLVPVSSIPAAPATTELTATPKETHFHPNSQPQQVVAATKPLIEPVPETESSAAHDVNEPPSPTQTPQQRKPAEVLSNTGPETDPITKQTPPNRIQHLPLEESSNTNPVPPYSDMPVAVIQVTLSCAGPVKLSGSAADIQTAGVLNEEWDTTLQAKFLMWVRESKRIKKWTNAPPGRPPMASLVSITNM